MPSYDVKNGQVIGAPASVQKSFDKFNGDKAPMSSAKGYLKQAAANPGKWQEDAKRNVFKG